MSNKVIDVEAFKAQHAAFEARIRPSSEYYGQSEEGQIFPVAITSPRDYGVVGGPRGQYRLKDVDLFAVFAEEAAPIQITFEG